MALLELEAVSKCYRRGTEEVVALDGVDFVVEHGEFVAIVGPSGSGKSTLLHLSGGLDTPDSGRVRVGGQDLSALSAVERATLRRRSIGFVFQFFHLLPTLSVAENVALPLLLDGRRSTTAAVREMLERVGLTHRSEHRPSQLSGGEMQRVAIARSLVTAPELLLADEPTGNLDSANGGAILDLLVQTVVDTSTALVMVTHDPGAATRAPRIVDFRDGRIADDAHPNGTADGRRPRGRRRAPLRAADR